MGLTKGYLWINKRSFITPTPIMRSGHFNVPPSSAHCHLFFFKTLLFNAPTPLLLSTVSSSLPLCIHLLTVLHLPCVCPALLFNRPSVARQRRERVGAQKYKHRTKAGRRRQTPSPLNKADSRVGLVITVEQQSAANCDGGKSKAGKQTDRLTD